MPLSIGSRIFQPRPVTTVLAVAALIALVSLGRWQLSRADQKRALYDAFDKGADATRRIDFATPPLPRYQHVEATGRYDGARQILIDNMTDAEGRAGYFVITPFALAGGGWLLVNRGWVPVGSSRTVLPSLPVDGGERSVRGRADRMPVPGIRLGRPAPLAAPFPVVADFPSLEDIGRLLHENGFTHAADLVLLDPDQPDGYLRQWKAPGIPPMRHIAYAVQWFGLAAALVVLYFVANTRRSAAQRSGA